MIVIITNISRSTSEMIAKVINTGEANAKSNSQSKTLNMDINTIFAFFVLVGSSLIGE